MFGLIAIGKNNGNGLEKICFAPLESPFANPITTDSCVVQSLWGYFKDDMDTFETEDEDSEGYMVNIQFVLKNGF